MNIFTTRTDLKHQDMDGADNYPRFLSHEDEPVDFYRKYKDDDFTPKKGKISPRNLFDDSDVKDNYWLNIVKSHLNTMGSTLRR